MFLEDVEENDQDIRKEMVDERNRRKEKEKMEEMELVDLSLDENLNEIHSMAGEINYRNWIPEPTKHDKNVYTVSDQADINIPVPSTSNDKASVLSCIIIAVFIEAKYPPELYQELFKSKGMEEMLRNMRKEERVLTMNMLEDDW